MLEKGRNSGITLASCIYYWSRVFWELQCGQIWSKFNVVIFLPFQGFKVCRYLFVRCDNEPAPWTRSSPLSVSLTHSSTISLLFVLIINLFANYYSVMSMVIARDHCLILRSWRVRQILQPGRKAQLGTMRYVEINFSISVLFLVCVEIKLYYYFTTNVARKICESPLLLLFEGSADHWCVPWLWSLNENVQIYELYDKSPYHINTKSSLSCLLLLLVITIQCF